MKPGTAWNIGIFFGFILSATILGAWNYQVGAMTIANLFWMAALIIGLAIAITIVLLLIFGWED